MTKTELLKLINSFMVALKRDISPENLKKEEKRTEQQKQQDKDAKNEDAKKKKDALEKLKKDQQEKENEQKAENRKTDDLKAKQKKLEDTISTQESDILRWEKLRLELENKRLHDLMKELDELKSQDVRTLKDKEETLTHLKDEIQTQEDKNKKVQDELDALNKQIKDQQNGEGPDDKRKKIQDDINQSMDSISKSNYIDAEKAIIDGKVNVIEAINSLPRRRSKGAYFCSIWGITPILLGILGISISVWVLWNWGMITMMGIIPVWASAAAVMGASVQILVGVVDDYRKDGRITEYRNLWYSSVIPISVAFGIIAFLLISAGLISLSQGAFILNPVNQTTTNILTNTTTIMSNMSVVNVVTNQTVSTPNNGTNLAVLALPLILCFLAGYATDWFMGLLANVTQTAGGGKK